MKNELNKIFAATECPPEELLRKYYEGKLSGIEKNSVEKHLASCEACSDELEGMFFINNNFNLDKTVAGLKDDINIRLGLVGEKKTFSLYFRIAAVITVLLVTSFIIYLTVNSNKTISKDSLSLNTVTEKSKQEIPLDQTIKAEEEKAETSKKSMSAKGVKSAEKETDLKSETQLMEKINPTQESVAGSTSKDVTIKSDEDKYFSTIAENKKELEKIDKKENAQDGTGAGVSNTVTQTGSGKASVKTVVVDASEQKVSENQNNISANSVVTTKISKETPKTDNSNSNIIADNRNQNNENNKQKEESRKQKKDETVSREKSKDELKNKKLSDEEEKKSKAEVTENDLALKEEASDKLAKRNTNTSAKETKKKAKAESHGKNNEAGSGELNLPSGKESEDYDQAMSKYKSGKYDEAVNLFQQIIAGNNSDYRALFYEGVCFYEQGKAEKAIVNFELVINLNSGEFADDARWYIALSYIKLNNKETARKKLQEIVSKGGKHKAKAEKKIDEVK